TISPAASPLRRARPPAIRSKWAKTGALDRASRLGGASAWAPASAGVWLWGRLPSSRWSRALPWAMVVPSFRRDYTTAVKNAIRRTDTDILSGFRRLRAGDRGLIAAPWTPAE